MKRVIWSFQVACLLAASFPLSFLPAGAGELFGLLLCRIWRSRRRIAIANVAKSWTSIGPSADRSPETIAQDSFRNIGRSFVEIVKIFYGRGDGLVRRTTVIGMDNLEKARAKGKGVIFITGHCGNWELLAMTSSFRGIPIAVVARPLNNPYLNNLLERARARYGNRVIYKKGALRQIMSTLKSGGGIGILMDQAVLPSEGYVIDFLGRGAWTTKMPALLARKTGAPVIPAFVRRTAKGHEITIYPEVELSSNDILDNALREDTRRFSGFIENFIRENPSQWLWLHRRWKRVPPENEGATTEPGGSKAAAEMRQENQPR
jgi:KDO2-lipid IV(A) lauroyltransferase